MGLKLFFIKAKGKLIILEFIHAWVGWTSSVIALCSIFLHHALLKSCNGRNKDEWGLLTHPCPALRQDGRPPDLHTFTHTKFPVPCPGLSWMKSQSFSPYPFALNYWYERREVILAFIQISLLERGWGKVRRRHSSYRWCFSLTPALKKAFSLEDKRADLPVENRSLSEGISPCKHGPVLAWPALAPAFPAACMGHCCVSILQRGNVTYSLHLQVLFVQSARCQGWEISHGSCVFHVIGLP